MRTLPRSGRCVCRRLGRHRAPAFWRLRRGRRSAGDAGITDAAVRSAETPVESVVPKGRRFGCGDAEDTGSERGRCRCRRSSQGRSGKIGAGGRRNTDKDTASAGVGARGERRTAGRMPEARGMPEAFGGDGRAPLVPTSGRRTRSGAVRSSPVRDPMSEGRFVRLNPFGGALPVRIGAVVSLSGGCAGGCGEDRRCARARGFSRRCACAGRLPVMIWNMLFLGI